MADADRQVQVDRAAALMVPMDPAAQADLEALAVVPEVRAAAEAALA